MLQRHAFRASALLFVAVVLTYAPALRHGFVWDDDAHLTPATLRTVAGLGRIWSEPGVTQQYYPLLHSLFWLEHALWGDAPLGYHGVNVVLHAGAAALFALVLWRLGVRGAVFAGLLFALHPVGAESVAWIAEQKNTLSTVFYLAAALAWWRFDATRERGAYRLALLWFVCALLTKTTTATLPAALLVVAWWRRGRLSWRHDVLPLVPWLVLGIAFGLHTAWLERHLIGAEGTAFTLSIAQRSMLAGRVIWFYLGKLVWPADLMFFYPRWTLSPVALLAWLPLAGTILAAALLWRLRQRTRAPLAVFLFFIGSLFPVLGFFDVYPFQYSFVADHFQYLPSLAMFALAGAGIAHLRRANAIALALGLPLAAMTLHETEKYRDARTLYRTTLAHNPASWIAWNNLGKELLGQPAERAEAIRCFERALALRPEYFEAENNLGLTLTQTGRAAEAIPHLQAAVRLKPASYQAPNNLGIALASSGRPAESLAAFARAAELNPTLPNIEENWAKALALLGRREEANRHFARAAELRNQPTAR